MEGFTSRYTIEESYQSSGHTIVMSVKRNSPTQRRRVAKMIMTHKMGDEAKRRVSREPKFMNVFKGNMMFVQIYRAVKADGVIYIIMEKCESDLLSHIINKPLLRDNAEWIRSTLRRLAEIVSYMHETGIVHRDIKLENFFVRADESICIGDFGLASRDVEKSSVSGVGTLHYAAPELFTKTKKIDMKKLDIYSLGITFYAIATHELPLSALVTVHVVRHKLLGSLEMKSTNDTNLDDLIDRMTLLAPEERPTISEVLAHEFFVN